MRSQRSLTYTMLGLAAAGAPAPVVGLCIPLIRHVHERCMSLKGQKIDESCVKMFLPDFVTVCSPGAQELYCIIGLCWIIPCPPLPPPEGRHTHKPSQACIVPLHHAPSHAHAERVVDPKYLEVLKQLEQAQNYGLAFHGGGTQDTGNTGVKTAHVRGKSMNSGIKGDGSWSWDGHIRK